MKVQNINASHPALHTVRTGTQTMSLTSQTAHIFVQ